MDGRDKPSHDENELIVSAMGDDADSVRAFCEMNIFDIAIYAGLLIAVVSGFQSGLLRSAATIVGYLIAMPVAVRRESPSPAARAMPKSVTIGRPEPWSMRMLSGLMSRWMTPRSCA